MKLLRQFGIIVLISCIGEVLKYILPFPIPASIYGMVIMLIALMTGVVKLESVEQVGDFLIEIMPIMFVPAAVGLLDTWGSLKPMLLAVVVITVAITVVVMAVTGWVTQWMLRRKKTEVHHE